MDRNSVTGIVLIGAIILIWLYFFSPKQPPKPAAGTPTPTEARTEPTLPDSQAAVGPAPVASGPQATVSAPDSTQAAARYGVFAPFASGTDRVVRVVTEDLTAEVHTHGAQLRPVTLNKHRDFRGQPLPVLPNNPETYLNLTFGYENRVIHTRDLYYTASTSESVSLQGEATQTVRLRAELAPGRYLEHIYTFRGTGYEVGYALKTVGLEGVLRGNFVDLEASVGVPWTEQNGQEQLNRTQVYYKSDEVEKLSVATDEVEEKKGILSADWVSLKSMFFQAALLPDTPFRDVSLRAEPLQPEGPTLPSLPLQRLSSTQRIQLASANADTVGMKLYLGPNDRSLLASYKVGLAEQLNLGWGPVGWINKGVIVPLFNLLEGITTNYGVIILLLAVFVKLVLSPLTYRSYVSNVKMQVVNNMAEVKALDEKYKDDPTKLQQAKLSFYNTVGVNPLAGCLPLLLQMPVFFAMFTFFPQSIELRQQAFWWANDLSTYDTLVNFGFKVPLLGAHLSGFALLMTVSQVVYTYVSQQGQTFSGPMASMKYMGYIFPIGFFFVLNSYSSGLSWYYLVINVLTIVQTYAIKATINQDKLHDKIVASREQRGKGGKPSGGGLAGWLEKQQKKQQEMIRERNDQRFNDMQKKARPRKR